MPIAPLSNSPLTAWVLSNQGMVNSTGRNSRQARPFFRLFRVSADPAPETDRQRPEASVQGALLPDGGQLPVIEFVSTIRPACRDDDQPDPALRDSLSGH